MPWHPPCALSNLIVLCALFYIRAPDLVLRPTVNSSHPLVSRADAEVFCHLDDFTLQLVNFFHKMFSICLCSFQGASSHHLASRAGVPARILRILCAFRLASQALRRFLSAIFRSLKTIQLREATVNSISHPFGRSYRYLCTVIQQFHLPISLPIDLAVNLHVSMVVDSLERR